MLGGAVGHNLKKNHRPRTITAKVGVPEQNFNLKRIQRMTDGRRMNMK
jgi:hypothetical protein